MRTIWKYSLGVCRGPQNISMPLGAKVLGVQIQNDVITFWAEVFEEASHELRRFFVFGTGWELPEFAELFHLGTVQQDGFVWHVYEER